MELVSWTDLLENQDIASVYHDIFYFILFFICYFIHDESFHYFRM